MSRICSVTGKRPVKGRRIIHRGQSKKSGGIGFQLDTSEEDSSYNRIKSLVNEELKQYFRRARGGKGGVGCGGCEEKQGTGQRSGCPGLTTRAHSHTHTH